jgi:hypothetical protein
MKIQPCGSEESESFGTAGDDPPKLFILRDHGYGGTVAGDLQLELKTARDTDAEILNCKRL